MIYPESLQHRFASLFVISAFLDEFNVSLSADIAFTLGLRLSDAPASEMHSVRRGFPMVSVLGAVQDICGRVEVKSAEDLELLLAALRKQFGAFDVCNRQDRQAALEGLEDCFEAAARAAREAWHEADAGFPLTGGSFPEWKRRFWNRRHQFADDEAAH